MNYVYNIIVKKNRKNTPEVGLYLKSIFTSTWELTRNKYNETWICMRSEPINIKDMVLFIKHLNKRIEGVMIQNVIVNTVAVEGYYHASGSEEFMNMMTNN